MLSIFSCAYWPSVCFLWRNVCLVFLPIFLLGCLFLLLLTCMSHLHILEINPLSVALFANIFSHSVGCFCILSRFPCCKSLQIWLGPICLFLLLFLMPWETDLRIHWYNLYQRMFCFYSLLNIKVLLYSTGNCIFNILWQAIMEKNMKRIIYESEKAMASHSSTLA